MQIAIKGRNGVQVDGELREYAEHRFAKVDRQVSELARLELEFSEEHNPAISDPCVVDAVLYLKGITLRASNHARDMKFAIHQVSDELSRQVERHREKSRHRREAHRLAVAEQHA